MAAGILTLVDILKCGYNLTNYYISILEKEILHTDAVIKNHNTEKINSIIGQGKNINACERILYLKIAMIAHLEKIKEEMDLLCNDTVSQYDKIFSFFHYQNPIAKYVTRLTKLYNRLKDIILFEPDFPTLIGYKSESSDFFFPELNLNVTLPDNSENTTKELDADEVEAFVKWNLQKSFLQTNHVDTEQGLKDLCKTHRRFHYLLIKKNNMIANKDFSTKHWSSSTDMNSLIETNTLQLQESEAKLDTRLIHISGFSNFINPLHMNVFTEKLGDQTKRTLKKSAKVMFKLTGSLFAPIRKFRLMHPMTNPSKKYYIEDLSEYILDKEPFPAVSHGIRVTLIVGEEEPAKAVSMLFKCYQLLLLYKVVKERLAQLRSEIDISAEMLNFDKETLSELEDLIRILSEETQMSNPRGVYTSIINRTVPDTKLSNERQTQEMHYNTTPLMQTIAPILTNMNPINEDETIDTLKNELLALREFMEQIATLSYGRLDETEIERYLKFVDKAIATNFRLSSIEEELKDLQDRVEKLEHITQNSM